MSKKLFKAAFLLGSLGMTIPAMAQNPASQPEFQLPLINGPVMRPQNASASTRQLVNGPSGTTENLYIHSWDVGTTDNNGIAWRRTDAAGSTIMEDFVYIKYASDIDAAIYEDGGKYFVLAAYYFDDGNPAMKGHYYDIYVFDASGLSLISPMNALTSSGSFGRINVDVSDYGVAIAWCVPGTGIYAKAASFPLSFGPDVLLPGTANRVDPDVCIRRGPGGSGSGLDLQIASLNNTLNTLYEHSVPFFNIAGGSAAGYAQEYTQSTTGINKYWPPRIDCPDKWSSAQRWAISVTDYNYQYFWLGAPANENTAAIVMNQDWSPTPAVVSLNSTTYTTNYYLPNYPVVAYNENSDVVTVGWMTTQPTAMYPSVTTAKYVAMDIKDDGFGMPSAIGGSYNMISNTPGSSPVLAFSGQNMNSSFDGLYIAFSQGTPISPNYNMMYKSRPWGLSTFKANVKLPAQQVKDLAVSPNPFTDKLSFRAPAKGAYTVYMTGIDGRVVLEQKYSLNEGENLSINTPEMASGTYVMNISSPENKVNYSQKLIRK